MINLKIELTKEEAANVRLALTQLAKSPQIDEVGMKVLLILSEKFAIKVDIPKKE